MKIRAALMAPFILLAASMASAETTYTASATSSGGPLSALEPGDVVTIDITVRTDGEATFGVTASAIGYNPEVAVFTGGESVSAVLASACFPTFGCIGGLDNSAFTVPTESLANPLGPEVQFVNAIGTAAAGGDGSIDEGVITGVAGDPQFRLIFTAGAEGTTTIILGSDPNYGDATIGTGGAILVTNNASVEITVPEPAAIASSLAALGSVAGVVVIRRRI